MFPGSKGFNLAVFILCIGVSFVSSTFFSYKRNLIKLNFKMKTKIEEEMKDKNEKEILRNISSQGKFRSSP